ncbi:MAG: zinc ribbon domain-containing protein [bacterium]
MPIYEFNCRQCGSSFEEILSFAELETETLRCPQCGSESVERGFSTFNTGSSGGNPGLPPCGRAGSCSGAGSGFS